MIRKQATIKARDKARAPDTNERVESNGLTSSERVLLALTHVVL